MMDINYDLKPEALGEKLERFWKLSGEKIRLIEKNYDPKKCSIT